MLYSLSCLPYKHSFALSRNLCSPNAARPALAASARIETVLRASRDQSDAIRLIEQGNVHEDQGNLDLALDCYRDAICVQPNLARAHMNLANALRKSHRDDEALAALRCAVECEPGYAPARFNLGQLLADAGQAELAMVQLRESLRLDPSLAEPGIVLADVLEAQGDRAAAERELRRVLADHPDHRGAGLNLLQLLLRQARYDDAERWIFQVISSNRALGEATLDAVLTSFNEGDTVDNEAIYRAHCWLGRWIEQNTGNKFSSWPNEPEPERRLRIAYVSGDFRQHPVASFMHPVLESHDSDRFDVHCYSNYGGTNEASRLLAPLVSSWRDVSLLADEQFAKRVRTDVIDILVDLSGHTAYNRLPVFARHPAPVQATWLGYLNTTGIASMDWRVCDHNTDPEGETDRFNAERLYRLPYSQWCYRPPHDIPEASISRSSKSHEIVFGSFNQHQRIGDACVRLWSDLLNRLPSARLVLVDVRDTSIARGLIDKFRKHRVDPSRLELRNRLPLRDYFQAIGDVDIALDTFPYNGATTTMNTLWMGVPIVALRGKRGLSRGSYSVLRTVDLPELIVESERDYITANVRLVENRERRIHLRSTLRETVKASPLTDSRRFVAALEHGYRHMWRDWCDRRAAHR